MYFQSMIVDLYKHPVKILLIGAMLLVLACEELLLEDDISDDKVEVLAPSNNTTLSATSVVFTWEPLEFADAYHLQVATPNFQAAVQVVEDTLIGQTNFAKTLVPANYQWRVKALNSAYETAYTTQSFTVED